MNFHARMENVFRFYGAVILTTIAVTIVTNPRIFAATKIALAVGADVPVTLTTVAFPNGSSVTAKMTAVTNPTNWMKIALLAKKKAILDAEIAVAFPKDGFAISKMTVGTIQMKVKRLAMAGTASVPNRNSGAKMTSAFRDVGNVTMTTTAVTVVTKTLAKLTHVRPANSNVNPDTASRKN